jgi:hypothetical protein
MRICTADQIAYTTPLSATIAPETAIHRRPVSAESGPAPGGEPFPGQATGGEVLGEALVTEVENPPGLTDDPGGHEQRLQMTT